MDAVVGLGSNLGSREALLSTAARLLDRHARVIALSRLYVTPPLGPPQPDFLNAAVRVRTDLPPRALLARMLEVEASLGRVRAERWGPRTIDLDLLWWEGGEVAEPDLVVPHPGLSERAFALTPLLDVAPELGRELGPRLAQLGAPPARAWTRIDQADQQLEARALDDADALALALSAALGQASSPREVHALEAASPAELCERAGALAGPRQARVVIEGAVSGTIRARVAVDPTAPRRPGAPSLRWLGQGRCALGPK